MRIDKYFHRRPSDALSVEWQLNSITAYSRTPYCRSPWFMVRDIFFGNGIFVSIRMPQWRLNFYKYSRKGSHYWPCDLGVRCGFSLYTGSYITCELDKYMIWYGLMTCWKCWIVSIFSPIHTLKLLSSPAAKWRKIAANCHYMHKHLYQISRLQFAIACRHWLLSPRIINPYHSLCTGFSDWRASGQGKNVSGDTSRPW
jgi:hypothetical protein